MLKTLFKIALISLMPAFNLHAVEEKSALWDSVGNPRYHFENLSAKDKAIVLEKYRPELEYCRQNLGKPFSELDRNKIGENAYRINEDAGCVANALIAYKYAQYKSFEKSAEYYYKDYLKSLDCAQKSLKSGAKGAGNCCSGGPTSAPVLPQAVHMLEFNNDYKGALRFYQMWYDDWASQFSGATLEEKKKSLRVQAEEMKGHTLGDDYNDLMEMWGRAKKLAKTSKQKPLDPAVQNHEWFYSDKQEEVLKALEYYHKFNVRFMLEKALKHKDPVIAAKAKEYLDTLVKEGDGNDKKK